MPRARDTACPFDFAGGPRGVLCVHGFSGSPFEMRFVARRLAERGFSAIGPSLPGHAPTDGPHELDATTWRDWVEQADRALDTLAARCDRVAVVGLSLGGLIALHLARHRGAELRAAASIGAPLWLPAYQRRAIRLLAGALAPLGRAAPLLALRKVLGSDIRDRIMRRTNPTMPAMPFRALASLLDFMELVRGELEGVTVPLLVAHARRDHIAPPASADEIAGRVGSREIRRLVLDRSYHVAPIDVERELLADALGNFLEERMV